MREGKHSSLSKLVRLSSSPCVLSSPDEKEEQEEQEESLHQHHHLYQQQLDDDLTISEMTATCTTPPPYLGPVDSDPTHLTFSTGFTVTPPPNPPRLAIRQQSFGRGGEEGKEKEGEGVFMSARRRKLLEAQGKSRVWEDNTDEDTEDEEETETETETETEWEGETDEDTEDEDTEDEDEEMGEERDWAVGEDVVEREKIEVHEEVVLSGGEGEEEEEEEEKVTEVIVAVKELRREEEVAEGRHDRREEKEEVGGGGGAGHQIDCFMRELQIMSSLSHPNVLKLYGFSRHPLQVSTTKITKNQSSKTKKIELT